MRPAILCVGIGAALAAGAACAQPAAGGGLKDCEIPGETPSGLRFGAAVGQVALAIAGAFTANPWDESGLPSVGARVRMPIRMNLSEPAADAKDAPPTPATTPAASPGSPPPAPTRPPG
jgi:hypothetical protein